VITGKAHSSVSADIPVASGNIPFPYRDAPVQRGHPRSSGNIPFFHGTIPFWGSPFSAARSVLRRAHEVLCSPFFLSRWMLACRHGAQTILGAPGEGTPDLAIGTTRWHDRLRRQPSPRAHRLRRTTRLRLQPSAGTHRLPAESDMALPPPIPCGRLGVLNPRLTGEWATSVWSRWHSGLGGRQSRGAAVYKRHM